MVDSKQKITKRLNKLERSVALSKPELKYHYAYVSTTVPNLGSTYYNCCNPTQGDGNNQRVGDSIRVHWVDIYIDVEAAEVDCHLIKPLGGTDPSPGYTDLSSSPGFFRPSEYKTYHRFFSTADGKFVDKYRVNLGGLIVRFVDNSPTTQNTIIYYMRNVGILTRSVRGTICCAYMDA